MLPHLHQKHQVQPSHTDAPASTFRRALQEMLPRTINSIERCHDMHCSGCSNAIVKRWQVVLEHVIRGNVGREMPSVHWDLFDVICMYHCSCSAGHKAFTMVIFIPKDKQMFDY